MNLTNLACLTSVLPGYTCHQILGILVPFCDKANAYVSTCFSYHIIHNIYDRGRVGSRHGGAMFCNSKIRTKPVKIQFRPKKEFSSPLQKVSHKIITVTRHQNDF